ncbi:MAG: ATP-binding protein [candidate division KSB1 bacterium]|nr:ATP-binding protein [candidate division KSB1 bacterium]MDZ7358833.1 ATP-binding protein [candidate division KSB1 bacterium]
MRNKVLTFFILLNLLSSSFTHASDPTKKYELLSIWQKTAIAFIPIDITPETPGDELVGVYQNQIDVLTNTTFDHQKSIIIPADKPYAIWPIPGASADSLRILFRHQTPTTTAFDFYLHDGDNLLLVKENFLFFQGEDRDLDGRFHQTAFPIAMLTNRNHQRRILLRVDSGGDRGMRGLFAIDPYSALEHWSYLTGPQICFIKCVDLENDGLQEIVFGSYAPDNKVKRNSTSDDSCYVFVLDDLGNERWRRTIGPYYTGVFPIVGDLTGDGKNELVVYRFGSNPNFKNYDELIQLDIRTGEEIGRKKLGSQFTANMAPAAIEICRDFDGDGIKEFVIGSKDGFVRMYRGDFSIMYSSEPYRRPITVHGVADLDGDGLFEVIALTSDKMIVILNHQLKQLLLEPFPKNFERFQLIRLPNKYQLLFSSKQINGFTDYQVFDFHVVGLAGAIKKHGQYYSIIILFLAAVTVAFVVLRNHLYGKRASQLLVQILEQTQSLDKALILDRHQKINHWGKEWSALLQILPHQIEGKKFQDIFKNTQFQPIGAALQKMLNENLSNHQCLCPIDNTNHVPLQFKALYVSWIKAHCFMIFDPREQEHIRQLKHWAQVAQRLAHGIKNPLTTVNLNAEQLLHKVRTNAQIQAGDVEEFITPIIKQVAKLKKMSDGFMRFVEFEQTDLKPVDLNREIRELIPQWQPGKTSKIQIDWELEEDLPLAMIDQRQFEHAVKNVFYNALESIRGEGRILISTRKVQLLKDAQEGGILSNFIELQIRDTGCGIPPEYLDRIRQPYFSFNKPDGTGLGLSIVQKIMDSHGGELEIESEVNVGTTVSLRFKQAS